MLYYDKIEFSEGIDNMTSESKECDICHFCYFKIKNLSFNYMYAIDS